MGTINGFLRLIRPVNCFMMGFAVLVGTTISVGTVIISSSVKLILGFLTGFTLTGSAMAINDYYDREIDAINEPNRPIPSGEVDSSEALAASMILSAMGLFLAWMTKLSCLAIAAFSWGVMALYSTRGKRTGFPGNLLVSICITLPFIYGALVIKNSIPASSLIFALMAFLSNTGREVTKSIVDVEGDREKGVYTITVSKGAEAAAKVASFFYIFSVVISIIPLLLGLISVWYIPFVTLTDLGLIHSSKVLIKNPSRENGRKVKNLVLIWMMSGLFGFLVGSL